MKKMKKFIMSHYSIILYVNSFYMSLGKKKYTKD